MNDRIKTRLRPQAVTSYAVDRGINYQSNNSWPQIKMTIGSVLIILDYNKEEDRDVDIKRLDDVIDSE